MPLPLIDIFFRIIGHWATPDLNFIILYYDYLVIIGGGDLSLSLRVFCES